MSALPPWNGLVLAGGHSRRMGTDKAQLAWHGRPQVQHLTELMQDLGAANVWVSCRPDQVAVMTALGLQPLPDAVPDLGPLGGLLTAFRHQGDRAWLVVAVDLPLLGRAALQALLAARAAGRPAVAFARPGREGEADPLAALWEPAMGPALEAAWAAGQHAPRQVLAQAGAHLLTPADPAWLRNANQPEEAAAIRRLLDE